MSVLLYLIFITIPEKAVVVLQTGVAGVEIYLDGNFVANTDENGALKMENFPAGSFKFSLKKEGFKPYESSFTIREAEAKLIHVTLDRIKARDKVVEAAADSQPISKLAGQKSHTTAATPQPQIRTKNGPVQTAAAPLPPVKQAFPTPASGESPEPFPILTWWLLAAVVAVAVAVWLFKSKRGEAEALPLNESAAPEEPQSTPEHSNRPAHDFIDELRHKEHLIMAGYVGDKPPDVDREGLKKKEVVIVLPKEAYRYEEEK